MQERLQVVLAAAFMTKEPKQLEASVTEVMRVLKDEALWKKLDPSAKAKTHPLDL